MVSMAFVDTISWLLLPKFFSATGTPLANQMDTWQSAVILSCHALASAICPWLGGRSLPTCQAGQRRWELAGGEGVEGAEAGGEFGVGEAAVAEEPAEEVFGGGLPLFRVAITTAGNEVAVGIAPRLGLRDDMVDGPYEDVKAEGGAGVRQLGNISKF